MSTRLVGTAEPRAGLAQLVTKECAMRPTGRASVSTHHLETLKRTVEWANFLNSESAGSDLSDPCCMLEALSDVYNAAHQLVEESNQWRPNLASGSAP